MNISSQKIPVKFKTLPLLADFLCQNGQAFIIKLARKLHALEGYPDNSNATYKQIADELQVFIVSPVTFKFYCAKNPFVGHNVISHATEKKYVNYNTRFHSIETFTLLDWLVNFFHELTHLADQISAYRFDHRNQSDYNSAPMVVGRLAKEVFIEGQGEWIL